MRGRDRKLSQQSSGGGFVSRITRGYSLIALLLALFLAALVMGGKYRTYIGVASGLLVLGLAAAKALAPPQRAERDEWGPHGPQARPHEQDPPKSGAPAPDSFAQQTAAELLNEVQLQSEARARILHGESDFDDTVALDDAFSLEPVAGGAAANPQEPFDPFDVHITVNPAASAPDPDESAPEAHVTGGESDPFDHSGESGDSASAPDSAEGTGETGAGAGAGVAEPPERTAEEHYHPMRVPSHPIKIRPLEERVIVKQAPRETASPPGQIVPNSAKEKPSEAQVIAVGAAQRQKLPSAAAAEDWADVGAAGHVLASASAPQVAPEVAKWVDEAPLAASLPLQPSLVPRLQPSKIQWARHTAQSPNTIRLLYGTDRARKISPRGVVDYSWRRGNRLDRGVCWVSIPPNNQHQTGALEGPSWFKLQFAFNPTKHITLHEIAPLERDLWLEHVRWLGTDLHTKQLLIFVHGYNVTFRDAARRTGQFVYDLGFGGVPMFYSWPSFGMTLLYTFDEAAVQNAESHLQAFIEDALRSGNFESAVIVAHSMGNRVMAAALERVIRKTAAFGTSIRHVILAAPDIDSGYFRDTVAPNLLALGLKMTMYVSARDRALAASRWFHGWPRVGDAKKAIVAIPGIDTIDATDVDTSFVGHSPFADRKELLSDIHYLIAGHQVGARHGLDQLLIDGVKYYKFRR